MMGAQTKSAAADIANDVLTADSDEAAKDVERRLADHPMAQELIEHLVRHDDPVIRIWAANRSADLLTDKSLAVLRRLMADRDSDVRSEAINHIVRIDPDGARSTVVRPLIRELRSANFGANRFALWLLTKLRATESLGAITEFRADRRNPWKESAGSVAVAIIEGRDEEVIEALRSHDHDRTQWLAIGASIIGSAAALNALRTCADDAPDEQCRADCARSLRDTRRVPRAAGSEQVPR